MRTPLYTRALTALAVVLLLATFGALPAGSGHETKPAVEPTIDAAAALPVVAQRAAYPDDRQSYPDGPEVSQTDGRPSITWPAPGPITSPFGGGRHHPGIDIDGVTGDPVIAAGTGTVVLAGMAPAGYSGYGNVVMIDHGGGISTLYAHLSRVDVTMGQVVQQGQQIGAIGATGMATGDHLHFEVRVANTPVDPLGWLPPRS
jgi:murein DD-endopeptidase MepM/ murein hydrolase activator NlpD